MRIGKFELRGIIIITENDAIGLQKSEALNHFRMLQILANATANLANGCECLMNTCDALMNDATTLRMFANCFLFVIYSPTSTDSTSSVKDVIIQHA